MGKGQQATPTLDPGLAMRLDRVLIELDLVSAIGWIEHLHDANKCYRTCNERLGSNYFWKVLDQCGTAKEVLEEFERRNCKPWITHVVQKHVFRV